METVILAGVVPLADESVSQDAFEVADQDAAGPVGLAREITADCTRAALPGVVVNCICDFEAIIEAAVDDGMNSID